MLATFTGYDWLIVVVYIFIGTLPGFLLRKYIRGQAEFLVAGRSLSVFLATATLTATELGLITVMYFAQLGFLHGFSAFTIGIIALVTTLFTGLTGFLVSGFRASGVTTFAEYYEKRYSRGVRLLGGLILAAAGILNYGVFLKIEAEFVRIITNIPSLRLTFPKGWNVEVLWSHDAAGAIAAATSLPAGSGVVLDSLKIVMSALVVLVLGYTLLGGMVSVVVTDYIQFIVLTLGMGICTWLVLTDHTTGGFAGLVDAVRKYRTHDGHGYGMNPFETASAGRVIFGLGGIFIAWQILHWTATSCWQTAAFRTAAADSPKTAKIMWSLTAVNYFGRAIIPMLWGIAALAYFAHAGIDPKSLDDMQAMPRYLAAILPAGIVGLLLAGMLAALMSTHSGYLLAWSGVITEDLLCPILQCAGITLSDRMRLWITRFFILCLGAYLLVFGLWYETKSSVWSFLALTGSMYFAGAATLLAFGLYWKRANIGGAWAGLICGAAPGAFAMAVYIIALSIEREITNPAHVPVSLAARINGHISEPLLGLISYPLGILGMIVGSLLYEHLRGRPRTGPQPQADDPNRTPSASEWASSEPRAQVSGPYSAPSDAANTEDSQ